MGQNLGNKTGGGAGQNTRNLVGPVIRKLRKQKNWSAEDFVARLELQNEKFAIEISANHLHKIERQEKPVSDFIIAACAEALGVSVNKLFEST